VSRERLRELGLAKQGALSHGHRMDVAVACDARAVNADVTVGPDGTVNGLNVSMHIDPALAAHPIAHPGAYARFVGSLDGASFTVNYLRVITLISVIPSVPAIVPGVIPASHGKPTSLVTDAMNVHVHEVTRDGWNVICVCSDGDGTCVHKTGKGYDLLADPMLTICASLCTGNRRSARRSQSPAPMLVTAVTLTTRVSACATWASTGKG
jgi:hypothetical protein